MVPAAVPAHKTVNSEGCTEVYQKTDQMWSVE